MASKVSGLIEKVQLVSGSTTTTQSIASTAYGYCETAAATAIKNVDMTGFKLEEGVTIHIKFANANSASNPKLKFNNEADTNAKPIVQYGTTAVGTTSATSGWYAGAVLTLTYDGTSWVRDQGFNTNDNTIPTHLYHYNNILARKAITAESLIVGDNTGYEKVASGITFDIAYPIVWCTGAVNANASNYANMYLSHYDRNIATGAKSGFSSSANKVIYLIVTISGTIATIDSNIITDTLPSTDDGKVYIRLGRLGAQSTGANYFLLYPEHPMFWYKNGAIRLYSGNSEYAVNAGTVNGLTVQTAVPANALFTDTNNAVTQTGITAANDYPILLKNSANTTDETTNVNYSKNVTSDVTTTKPFTYNPDTGLLTVSKIQIGIKNDSFGFLPYLNNWNSLGASNLYWYRSYITHYYGATSHVTNWDSNNNIGTAATASAASTLGKVNFYNTCAANGTQTKTTLTADSTTNSNITITLPKSTGTLALVGDNSHTHNYAGSSSAGGAATSANALNFVHTNEILMGNTNAQAGIHINHRRVLNGATSDNTAITDYYFKNGNGATTGVTVHAANFNGLAAKATSDSDGNTIKTTYAKLASPALTGTPTAPTAADGTNTTQLATTAFVMSQFKYNDAMIYKGVVNANSDLPATHYQGWTYKVATAGTYVGIACEIGDMIICNTDGTSANNAHWNVIQTNIDGAVTSSSTDPVDNAIARFDGTTGRIIQKSGITIDDNSNLIISHTTNATMTAASTNPQIIFAESGSQPVHLIYTDYDNYRSPAGLKVIGDSGASSSPAWFEVEGSIYANAGNRVPNTGNTTGTVGSSTKTIYVDAGVIKEGTTLGTAATHAHGDYALASHDHNSISSIKYYTNTCNAGGSTYTGWIKIASADIGENNYWGNQVFDIFLSRTYNSPSSEVYNIRVIAGWGSTNIIQLGGKYGTQIITKFRVVRDHTNHKAYFEYYVKPEYSTYQNGVNFKIICYHGATLTWLNTVQSEDDSAFTYKEEINLTNGLIGDLTGNATTATTAGNVTGTVAIANGGTGATTAADARTNLGITATNIIGTGTTAQFYRGDNNWSNQLEGLLKIKSSGITATIGSSNNGWIHFTNDSSKPYYFDQPISAVTGFKVYNSTTSLTDDKLAFSSGGGWYMSDTSWIRTVGSKNVYMNTGTFRNDGTTSARVFSHINANIIEDGSWITGATGVAPTATILNGETTYSGATIGTSILTLGNNKIGGNNASGVKDNARGYLRLYSDGSGYASITAYNGDKTRLYPEEGIAIPENKIGLMFRPGLAGYYTYTSYQTSGNEALIFGTKYGATSFIFVNGEDPANIAADRWTKLTGAANEGNAPGLQIKSNCVSIGELVANGVTPSYKLKVNGQTRLNSSSASSTTNLTGQLIISNSSGGNVALELWREGNASWQVANESGNLYIRNNYTTAKQNTYTQTSISINYNTGNTTFAGSVTATGGFSGALSGTATTADKLTGFSSRATTMGWGNQTGSVITCFATPGGGGWGFRDNNPASGQTSMTIDGTIYIKEGGVNISDAVKTFSVSGQTVTYTNLWGGTGTFTTQDTKNTAGSTDSTSKLYLIGATSQAANPQTYSDSHVFETNGAFSAKTVGINNDTDADKVTLQWNSTDLSLDFIFA